MPSSEHSAVSSRLQGKWKRTLLLGAGSVAVLAGCLLIRYCWLDSQVQAQQRPPRFFFQKQEAEATATAKSDVPVAAQTGIPDVVAVVNGEKITRELLGADCLNRYGQGVLDSLINKRLIVAYCQQQGITVTQQEVEQEIGRIAARFRLPVDQWLKMLKEERHIAPDQYANEIIWPMIALRKAAAQSLEVSPQEVQAAYETQYGEAVEARLIVCYDEAKAREALAEVRANPNDFGPLAAKYSDDPTSASAHGRVLPIRKHLGDPKIEAAAFSMQPGQISDLIQIDRQWVILKCEGRAESRAEHFPIERVKTQLEAAVREKKENAQAGQLFEQLKQQTRIVQCYGNEENSQHYPGVAAVVGNFTVTTAELQTEAIRRHGVEVLEGTIGRSILHQHIRDKEVQVSDEDLQREVVRAAEAMGAIDQRTGQVDVKGWLASVSEEQGLTTERYLDEIVWPTAALKNYVWKTDANSIDVTEEDLQRGFEANFGPRCICRAIMLNNQRAAQEVWDQARQNPNAIFFGQLAAKYSIDPQSRSLSGEVPPIQRHGGRPTLEAEAFKLKQGEISGIIQINEFYLILFCEGYTKPITRDFEEVKTEIQRDLFEKKLRVEMAKAYNGMIESARIENFLAGTRQAPGQAGGTKGLSQPPRLQQQPGGASPVGAAPGSTNRPG